MATTLYIKNMVCDRCKMAVDKTLRDNRLTPVNVDLGIALVEEAVSPEQRQKLRSDLQQLGFELLDDKRQQTILRMKELIIQLVHYRQDQLTGRLSDYISSALHSDYSSLSKLFSEVTGKTLERYYMEQRIERVKELIRYDELSLTEIAYRVHYSSVAHLSSQFKSVTGMTPTQFKRLKENARRPLDKI